MSYQRGKVLSFGALALSIGNRLLANGGKIVPLGACAMDLLIVLVEQANKGRWQENPDRARLGCRVAPLGVCWRRSVQRPVRLCRAYSDFYALSSSSSALASCRSGVSRPSANQP